MRVVAFRHPSTHYSTIRVERQVLHPKTIKCYSVLFRRFSLKNPKWLNEPTSCDRN